MGNRASVAGRVSRSKVTKNEPVAGRNIFHRARPWLGAVPAPWLWTGGTKEVGTLSEMTGDPGRHGRFAAVVGWVYTKAM